jgi:hypothetical protein
MYNATDMPISGPKHAINFQSIKLRPFERPEKNFVSHVRRDFAPGDADRTRTVRAQPKGFPRVILVRHTPEPCTHPINTISFLIDRKLIYFYRDVCAIFCRILQESSTWIGSRITGSND